MIHFRVRYDKDYFESKSDDFSHYDAIYLLKNGYEIFIGENKLNEEDARKDPVELLENFASCVTNTNVLCSPVVINEISGAEKKGVYDDFLSVTIWLKDKDFCLEIGVTKLGGNLNDVENLLKNLIIEKI